MVLTGGTSGAAAVTVREAAHGDVPRVVAMVNSAYRGDSSKAGWTTEADLLGGQRIDAAAVTALIADPGTAVLVSEADGRLLVCCELKRSTEGSAYFGMFSVSPAAQGRGVGGMMMTEAERHAAETWDSHRMRMLVIRQRAELIAWYERRGYIRTGLTEPFPYGDERFGIPQRDDLEFIELAKDLPNGAAAR